MNPGRYFKIFLKSFSNNLAIEMSFRVNFILIFLVEILHLIILLASVFVLFEHVDTIGPWNRNDFLFFSTLVIIFDSLFLGFLAGNFWNFSNLLRLGTFDFILTKPINSLFLTLTQVQRFSGVVTALLSLVILIGLSFYLDISLTASHWFVFAFLFVLSFFLRVGMEVLVATLMFITIEGEAINFFRINLQQFAKHPSFIYSGTLNFILTKVFPLCLVTTLPASWFIGKDIPPLHFLEACTWLLGLGALFWVLAASCWKWGINKYESASS